MNQKAFIGNRAFLSNFYPCTVHYNGLRFPTVEHAYVAAKTDDPELQKLVQQCKTPAVAKEFGKTIPLRDGALEDRLSVMENLLTQKFRQPFLRQQLLDTGFEKLIEYNYWHDNFWGVCTCGDCEVGANNLGRLLMKVRAAIRNEESGELFDD